MRTSIVKSLLQTGAQCYTNVLRWETSSALSNDRHIRSIRKAQSMVDSDSPATIAERREMMALWPEIFRDATETKHHSDIPEPIKWMGKVLQYNVPNGQQLRSLELMYAYRMIAPPEQLTEENLRLARKLAWCIEMHQSSLLLVDDYMDGAQMRRGQPCWHVHDNVGLTLVNDAILLEHAAYQLLTKYFQKEKCYSDIVEIFHDTTLNIALGQTLDIQLSNFNKPNLNLFTTERYDALKKYKAAYYAFLMPVRLALHLARVTDPETHREARKILLEIGDLYQAQNDYLDLYGDPSVTGDNETDIQSGKCTWFVVVALQRATPSQRKILEECYGCEDPEKVRRVKELFEELGLPAIFMEYEEERYNLINTHIQEMSCNLPRELFFKFSSMIYGRAA